MAGGVSTPELAAAVSRAGGLGFLAAGMKTAAAVASDIVSVREVTDEGFGVNVFVPTHAPADADAVQGYADQLRAEGTEPGESHFHDDDWEAKVDLIEREHPAVASFTFGCPSAKIVATLQAAGTEVWVTVTSPREAGEACAAGADALVAQGIEAGGHRGAFSEESAGEYGLLTLLDLLGGARSPVPLVATGGIATTTAVAAVITAGAAAAQVGTAFMLCPEAGTSDLHRQAVAQPAPTALTRAFTGRKARGIANRFMAGHRDAPVAYPELLHVTAPMRAAAAAAGDPERLNLWAGQAHELARAIPAGALVAELGGASAAA